MGIEKENYGVTKEGKQVTKYTLTNGQGASVSFLDYGAVIQSIIVPDKDGKLEDVVLGYDTLSGYESNVPEFWIAGRTLCKPYFKCLLCIKW